MKDVSGYYGDFSCLAEEVEAYNQSNREAYERGDLTQDQMDELYPAPATPSDGLPF